MFRNIKLRKALLDGVYEHNLKIMGKSYKIDPHKLTFPLIKIDSHKRTFPLNKIFIVMSISLIVIFAHSSEFAPSFIAESRIEMPISVNYDSPVIPVNLSQPVYEHVPENTQNPSDYQMLIDNQKIPISRMFGLGVKTIMIDPGHGGEDTGTKGKMGTLEKDITLDIAKRLKNRLNRHNKFKILMTRENDETLPLYKRVEMARLGKTDLFISIHLNYLPSKPINTIETYYFGPTSNTKTLKLVQQENAGSQYGLGEFKEIIGKIGETLKLQESRKLAVAIQKNLFLKSKKTDVNIHDYGVKRAPFIVLVGVDVPAVLAEVSCLSNIKEEAELHNEGHRENIAHYLEAGILDYLKKGEMSYEAKRRTEE